MNAIPKTASSDLVARATKLVPLLQRNAVEAEERRQLPPEVIDALDESGLLRLRVPTRYGGYESDMRETVDVLAELAMGDGSTSWTAAVWAISTWVVGLFPDVVQDEVFATPDVKICGILSPTAMGAPVDGGITVNGKWSFNTGAPQSHWAVNAAVVVGRDGQPEPVMILVPMSELRIIDDWHTAGIRGSGSVTTVAEEVFVPQERVLPLGPILSQQYDLGRNAGSAMYQVPFLPMACATVSGPVLGLAKAAYETFFDRLPGRKITYTNYDDQSHAPLTHLEVGEAHVKIDESEFHALRAAELIDMRARTQEAWTMFDRARARLDLGASGQRAKEAVDILAAASGGSSIYTSVPIQRIQRDIMTLNLHGIIHPSTNLELFGRVLCGLEPNTDYI